MISESINCNLTPFSVRGGYHSLFVSPLAREGTIVKLFTGIQNQYVLSDQMAPTSEGPIRSMYLSEHRS